MSEAMLALLGFATIIVVIALLLRNVTVPALAFVSVSTVTGAILYDQRNGGIYFSRCVRSTWYCGVVYLLSTLLWNYDRCRNVR